MSARPVSDRDGVNDAKQHDVDRQFSRELPHFRRDKDRRAVVYRFFKLWLAGYIPDDCISGSGFVSLEGKLLTLTEVEDTIFKFETEIEEKEVSCQPPLENRRGFPRIFHADDGAMEWLIDAFNWKSSCHVQDTMFDQERLGVNTLLEFRRRTELPVHNTINLTQKEACGHIKRYLRVLAEFEILMPWTHPAGGLLCFKKDYLTKYLEPGMVSKQDELEPEEDDHKLQWVASRRQLHFCNVADKKSPAFEPTVEEIRKVNIAYPEENQDHYRKYYVRTVKLRQWKACWTQELRFGQNAHRDLFIADDNYRAVMEEHIPANKKFSIAPAFYDVIKEYLEDVKFHDGLTVNYEAASYAFTYHIKCNLKKYFNGTDVWKLQMEEDDPLARAIGRNSLHYLEKEYILRTQLLDRKIPLSRRQTEIFDRQYVSESWESLWTTKEFLRRLSSTRNHAGRITMANGQVTGAEGDPVLDGRVHLVHVDPRLLAVIKQHHRLAVEPKYNKDRVTYPVDAVINAFCEHMKENFAAKRHTPDYSGDGAIEVILQPQALSSMKADIKALFKEEPTRVWILRLTHAVRSQMTVLKPEEIAKLPYWHEELSDAAKDDEHRALLNGIRFEEQRAYVKVTTLSSMDDRNMQQGGMHHPLRINQLKQHEAIYDAKLESRDKELSKRVDNLEIRVQTVAENMRRAEDKHDASESFDLKVDNRLTDVKDDVPHIPADQGSNHSDKKEELITSAGDENRIITVSTDDWSEEDENDVSNHFSQRHSVAVRTGKMKRDKPSIRREWEGKTTICEKCGHPPNHKRKCPYANKQITSYTCSICKMGKHSQNVCLYKNCRKCCLNHSARGGRLCVYLHWKENRTVCSKCSRGYHLEEHCVYGIGRYRCAYCSQLHWEESPSSCPYRNAPRTQTLCTTCNGGYHTAGYCREELCWKCNGYHNVMRGTVCRQRIGKIAKDICSSCRNGHHKEEDCTAALGDVACAKCNEFYHVGSHAPLHVCIYQEEQGGKLCQRCYRGWHQEIQCQSDSCWKCGSRRHNLTYSSPCLFATYPLAGSYCTDCSTGYHTSEECREVWRGWKCLDDCGFYHPDDESLSTSYVQVSKYTIARTCWDLVDGKSGFPRTIAGKKAAEVEGFEVISEDETDWCKLDAVTAAPKKINAKSENIKPLPYDRYNALLKLNAEVETEKQPAMKITSANLAEEDPIIGQNEPVIKTMEKMDTENTNLTSSHLEEPMDIHTPELLQAIINVQKKEMNLAKEDNNDAEDADDHDQGEVKTSPPPPGGCAEMSCAEDLTKESINSPIIILEDLPCSNNDYDEDTAMRAIPKTNFEQRDLVIHRIMEWSQWTVEGNRTRPHQARIYTDSLQTGRYVNEIVQPFDGRSQLMEPNIIQEHSREQPLTQAINYWTKDSVAPVGFQHLRRERRVEDKTAWEKVPRGFEEDYTVILSCTDTIGFYGITFVRANDDKEVWDFAVRETIERCPISEALAYWMFFHNQYKDVFWEGIPADQPMTPRIWTRIGVAGKDTDISKEELIRGFESKVKTNPIVRRGYGFKRNWTDPIDGISWQAMRLVERERRKKDRISIFEGHHHRTSSTAEVLMHTLNHRSCSNEYNYELSVDRIIRVEDIATFDGQDDYFHPKELRAKEWLTKCAVKAVYYDLSDDQVIELFMKTADGECLIRLETLKMESVSDIVETICALYVPYISGDHAKSWIVHAKPELRHCSLTMWIELVYYYMRYLPFDEDTCRDEYEEWNIICLETCVRGMDKRIRTPVLRELLIRGYDASKDNYGYRNENVINMIFAARQEVINQESLLREDKAIMNDRKIARRESDHLEESAHATEDGIDVVVGRFVVRKVNEDGELSQLPKERTFTSWHWTKHIDFANPEIGGEELLSHHLTKKLPSCKTIMQWEDAIIVNNWLMEVEDYCEKRKFNMEQSVRFIKEICGQEAREIIFTRTPNVNDLDMNLGEVVRRINHQYIGAFTKEEAIEKLETMEPEEDETMDKWLKKIRHLGHFVRGNRENLEERLNRLTAQQKAIMKMVNSHTKEAVEEAILGHEKDLNAGFDIDNPSSDWKIIDIADGQSYVTQRGIATDNEKLRMRARHLTGLDIDQCKMVADNNLKIKKLQDGLNKTGKQLDLLTQMVMKHPPPVISDLNDEDDPDEDFIRKETVKFKEQLEIIAGTIERVEKKMQTLQAGDQSMREALHGTKTVVDGITVAIEKQREMTHALISTVTKIARRCTLARQDRDGLNDKLELLSTDALEAQEMHIEDIDDLHHKIQGLGRNITRQLSNWEERLSHHQKKVEEVWQQQDVRDAHQLFRLDELRESVRRLQSQVDHVGVGSANLLAPNLVLGDKARTTDYLELNSHLKTGGARVKDDSSNEFDHAKRSRREALMIPQPDDDGRHSEPPLPGGTKIDTLTESKKDEDRKRRTMTMEEQTSESSNFKLNCRNSTGKFMKLVPNTLDRQVKSTKKSLRFQCNRTSWNWIQHHEVAAAVGEGVSIHRWSELFRSNHIIAEWADVAFGTDSIPTNWKIYWARSGQAENYRDELFVVRRDLEKDVKEVGVRMNHTQWLFLASTPAPTSEERKAYSVDQANYQRLYTAIIECDQSITAVTQQITALQMIREYAGGFRMLPSVSRFNNLGDSLSGMKLKLLNDETRNT